jgi:hypothetical protein
MVSESYLLSEHEQGRAYIITFKFKKLSIKKIY